MLWIAARYRRRGQFLSDDADGPLRPTTGDRYGNAKSTCFRTNDLDAVAGGTMNNGQGNFLLPKPPIKGGPVHGIPRDILEAAAV